jgi:hypothetical protein
VKVSVEAERFVGGGVELLKVTEAEVVLVAVGPDGRPVPILEAPAPVPGAGPAGGALS